MNAWATALITIVTAFGGAWFGSVLQGRRNANDRRAVELDNWRLQLADDLAEAAEVLALVKPERLRAIADDEARATAAVLAAQRWQATRAALRRAAAAHPDDGVVRASMQVVGEMEGVMAEALAASFAAPMPEGPSAEHLQILLEALRRGPGDPPLPTYETKEQIEGRWGILEARIGDAGTVCGRLREVVRSSSTPDPRPWWRFGR